MEGPMPSRKIVRALRCFMAREYTLLAPFPRGDVDAAPLHEVAS